jgi:hypothetical protein
MSNIKCAVSERVNTVLSLCINPFSLPSSIPHGFLSFSSLFLHIFKYTLLPLISNAFLLFPLPCTAFSLLHLLAHLSHTFSWSLPPGTVYIPLTLVPLSNFPYVLPSPPFMLSSASLPAFLRGSILPGPFYWVLPPPSMLSCAPISPCILMWLGPFRTFLLGTPPLMLPWALSLPVYSRGSVLPGPFYWLLPPPMLFCAPVSPCIFA